MTATTTATLAALVAFWAIAIRPGEVRMSRLREIARGWIGRAPRLATVRYLDGPLAGRLDQRAMERGGAPALQICALVRREAKAGGDYTFPYQRGVICDGDGTWPYTQGWNKNDAVTAMALEEVRAR